MSFDFQDSNPESLISWASPVPLCHSVPANHQCMLVFIPLHTLQSSLTTPCCRLPFGSYPVAEYSIVLLPSNICLISHDIPTYPYLCCVYPSISLHIPTYALVMQDLGLSLDNPMSGITQKFLEYPWCFCVFLEDFMRKTGANPG